MPEYKAVQPEQAGYNIFTPLWAQTLTRPTGNPGADVINQIILAARSRGEGASYADAIAQAQAAQLQGQEMVGQQEIANTYLEQMAKLAEAGILQGVQTNQPYVGMIPEVARQAGAVHLDRQAAAALAERAGAVADLSEADVRPSIEAISGMMSNPLQETPTAIEPYITTRNQAEATKAAADMIKAQADTVRAQASMISANRPGGGGGGGDGGGGGSGVKIDYTPSTFPGLTPDSAKIKGDDPAAIAAAAIALRAATQSAGVAGGNMRHNPSTQRRVPLYRPNPETGKRERNPDHPRWQRK